MERDLFRRCVRRVRSFLAPYWRGGKRGLRKYVRKLLTPFRNNQHILSELIRTPVKILAMLGLTWGLVQGTGITPNTAPQGLRAMSPTTAQDEALAATLPSPERLQAELGPDAERNEIVFIDEGLPNSGALAQAARPGTSVHFLKADRGGVAQVTEVLAAKQDVDAVHILSKGGTGYILLGTDAVSADSLDYFSSDLAEWKPALTEKADIMLYGCFAADEADGDALLRGFSQHTGADVAGSVDLTGGDAANGDWDLEHEVGEINTATLKMRAWDGHMAIFTVINSNDSGPGSLRYAIDQANAAPGPDDIAFDASMKGATITLKSGLDITDDVTITGPGASSLTVDADGNGSAMYVDTSGTVNISGLTIANGYGVAGGGIANYGAILNVSDCTFVNNQGYLGGAIANIGGIATIADSTFESNGFKYDKSGDPPTNLGGAIYNSPDGEVTVSGSLGIYNEGRAGAIYNEGGKVTVSNSILVQNNGELSGAMVDKYGSTTIDSSVISQNFGAFGGVSAYGSDVTLNDSSIALNSLGGIGSFKSEMTLNRSDVSNNVLGIWSGGIFNAGDGASGNLTLNDSTVTGNLKYGSDSGLPDGEYYGFLFSGGAGITNAGGSVTLQNSKITNNTATWDIDQEGFNTLPIASAYGPVGGLSSIGGEVTLQDSVVSGNEAVCKYYEVPDPDQPGIGTGGMRTFLDSVTIANSSVSDNYGEGAGGLSSIGSKLTVTDSNFSRNFGRYGAGGLIQFGYSEGSSIANSTITSNSTFAGPGGGIANLYGADLKITDSKILLNSTTTPPVRGVGPAPVGTAAAPRSSISGLHRAAGIYQEGGELLLSGSTLVGNYDAGESSGPPEYYTLGSIGAGGLVSSYKSLVEITNSTIANNYGEYAGGILNTDSELTIDNSTLSGNEAQRGVGGLLNYGIANIRNSVVAENGSGLPSAYYIRRAGGIVHGGGPLTIDASIIRDNRGYQAGGILIGRHRVTPTVVVPLDFDYGYTKATITNSTVSDNAAWGPGQGGGVRIEEGEATLERSSVVGNYASDGGGIHQSGGKLYVLNSTLARNRAQYNNGGGLVTESGTATIQNSTISGNYANWFGGGVRVDGGNVSVYNSTIANNTAYDGGGLDLNAGTTKLQSTVVADNAATSPGEDARGNASAVTYCLIGNSTKFTFPADPSNLVDVPAGLGPLANNGGPTLTHALLDGSLAIDKGSNPLTLATDQRGGLRLIGAGPDIGAFEHGNNPPTATNLDQYHLYSPNAPSVDLDDIVVADIDPGEQITVTLTVADPTTGSLTATTGNGEAYDPATGVWTITGSVPQVNDALANVGFVPNAASPGDTTIAVVVQDAGGAPPLNGTITMDADNIQPVINSVDATPNPTVVGQTVTFTVDATDADGDTLTITWDFGDGASGTGATADHAYAAEGSYTVTVTVDDGVTPAVTQTLTVTVGLSDTVAGVGPDSDGDGFSDSLEEFVGTSPTDPGSTPMDIGPIIEAPLTSLRAIKILLKFKPEIVGKDRIRLIADLPVPDGFNFAGKELVVDIGGVQKKFVLDERRRGQDGLTRVTLGRPKFGFARMKLARKFMGDYRDLLAATSGLINADVLGETRTLRVTVLWNDQALVSNENVPYKAKLNKKGIVNKRVNNP